MLNFLKKLTPLQATLLLVLATTLLRLVAGVTTELTTDEAHYALYGYHLDWSYFDHPSLIGWLQALMLDFSSTDLAMRLWPILLFSAASLLLYRVVAVLFPQESRWLAFVSVALMQSSVMLQLIGMAMLPDSPLLLLALLVLLVLQRILAQGGVRNWLLLGLLLGLAGISKYTAVTMVLTVLLALHFGRQWRQVLTPGPWLALLLATLVITPVLYWNYTHEWISFLFQLKHGTAQLDWQFKRVLVSQAGQLLVYGPLLYVFGMIALVSALKKFGKLDSEQERGTMLLLALALPLLLLFGWNSGYEMTLPHWTSLGWVALSPLAAQWIFRSWHKRWVRISSKASAIFAVILLGAVFSQLIKPWWPFPEGNHYLKDLYGWSDAARRAEQLRAEMDSAGPAAPYLFVENWTLGSRLSWYARPVPLQVLDEKINQFDIWYGSPQDGARGILVLWPTAAATPATGGHGQFTSCALRDRMPVLVNGRLAATFSFFACDGYNK
jgi:4-amino-4-deoxy-L-arabinose transferase-like glycosyltransferase